MAYVGAAPANRVLSSADIAQGSVTLDDINFTDQPANMDISGTINKHTMRLADGVTVTGDVTISDDLVLAKLSDDGNAITLTDDGSSRTITGSGSIEATTLAQTPNASLTGMTGTVGSGVTIGSAVTNNAGAASGTIGSGVTFPTMAKVGTFSRAVAGTPGDVSYTGVGFQPSVIHFVASIQDGTSRSWGMDDGTTHLCLMTQFTLHTSGTPGANTDNKSIYVHYSATLGTKAIVKTMDSDGFTLTWYDIGDPSTGTVVVMYTAFR